MYSKVTKNVQILPRLMRRAPLPPRPSVAYASRLEIREFVRDLAWLLGMLARLLPDSRMRVPGTPSGLVIVGIEARPRVHKGDSETVYVTVSNPGPTEEAGEIVLSDATERVLIGRQDVALLPGGSQTLQFRWETRRFRLGDHDLDAEIRTPDGWRREDRSSSGPRGVPLRA